MPVAFSPPKIALPMADTGPPPPIVPEWLNSNVPTVFDAALAMLRTKITPKHRHWAAVAEATGVRLPDTAPNSGLVFALPSRAASVYVPGVAAVVLVPDANNR